MFRLITPLLPRCTLQRLFTTSPVSCHRVAIIGAAGGVGQALALLMKADSMVTELVLYDRNSVAGIGADISHIDTNSSVQAISGKGKMTEALECTALVICAAGVSKSSAKQSNEELFKANAQVITELMENVAKTCPAAFLAIITSPINSIIPLAAEILKKKNSYDPKKLFGISRLDISRSRTFISDQLAIDPLKVQCEVIGGRSSVTLVPVISRATPYVKVEEEILSALYARIRNGDEAVVKAKGGLGTSQLCIANAAADFCHGLLRALSNEPGVEEIAYVESKVLPDVQYFSSKFNIGPEGIKKFHPLPELSEYEKKLLEGAVHELRKNIEMGVAYAKKKKNGKK